MAKRAKSTHEELPREEAPATAQQALAELQANRPPVVAETVDYRKEKAARVAAAKLGVREELLTGADKPFSLDGASVPVYKHCRRVIAQIDAVRGSLSWRSLNPFHRQVLVAVQVFARELIGEPVPTGQYKNIKEMLGADHAAIVGVLSDQTDVARMRRTGEMSPAKIAEIVGD